MFWRLSLSPDYPAHMLPGLLMTGVGVGLTLPTLVGAGMSAVPPHRFPTGSGVVTVLGNPATPLGSLTAFQHATVFTGTGAGLAGLSSLPLIRVRRRASRVS